MQISSDSQKWFPGVEVDSSPTTSQQIREHVFIRLLVDDDWE